MIAAKRSKSTEGSENDEEVASHVHPLGFLGAAVTGKLNLAQFDWTSPVLRFAVPTFSWPVLIVYAPVLAVLITTSGVALISVLMTALQDAARGPLVWGPLLTFAIAVSKISHLGFGPLFWALIIGTATSVLLEKPQLDSLSG